MLSHRRPSHKAMAFPARRSLVVFALSLGLASAALAQEAGYPQRPVRMVVSYAAGNVTDVLARIVADKLSEKWGQPVVVDNKPGQGGSVGAQMAAKSPNDGYTLLFSAMAALAINPHVYPAVGYNALKDFVPVINVASPDALIVVSPALNIQSYGQLVAYSKANPTAISYGSAGNGTVPHLNIETLKAESGLVAQHVPYKAASAALTDLIGGRIQLQSDATSVLLPQVKAGKLVPLVALTSTGKRMSQLPDVPTLPELMPNVKPVVTWLGILAPVGTPANIVSKIHRDVSGILALRDVQEKFSGAGLEIQGDGPEAFSRTLASDYDRMGKLVKQINLKVD